ncbi:hypothetical protein JW835_12670 [bacterium]|nr:hypothetical protein [bacterium]
MPNHLHGLVWIINHDGNREPGKNILLKSAGAAHGRAPLQQPPKFPSVHLSRDINPQ